MRLLLDTHVLLWWLDDPASLSDAARIEIANPRNAVYVSAASLQEIVIKQAQNKLTCPDPLLPSLEENRFSPLPITLDHALAMGSLPPLHKDPFDRQLLAQCQAERMTLVTRDDTLTKYGVPFLLA
jgi:PIN domain nuclease of toxin-antitoxin system